MKTIYYLVWVFCCIAPISSVLSEIGKSTENHAPTDSSPIQMNQAEVIDPGPFVQSENKPYEAPDLSTLSPKNEKGNKSLGLAPPPATTQNSEQVITSTVQTSLKNLMDNPQDAQAKRQLDQAFQQNKDLVTKLMQEKFGSGITKERLEREGCGEVACKECEAAKKRQGKS